jgi:Tfp pilus assembly protein PilO
MSRTNRMIIGLVATAALVAAYWFLLLGPKRDEAVQLQTNITTKQAEIASVKAQIAVYETARTTYQANYATIARLGKAVPADDDVRSLMVQLEDAAVRSGVDFRLIDVGKGAAAPSGAGQTTPTGPVIPGASVGTAGFSSLPFNFSFEGTYFELSEFFTRLERMVDVNNTKLDVTGRLLLLQNITLQPDSAGFPHIKAQIGATSYMVPPTEGLMGGATAQGPAATSTPSTTAPSGTTAPATTASITGVN